MKLICNYCKIYFKSNNSRRKYCSLACRDKSKIVYSICAFCNKIFKGGNKRRYCSKECYHATPKSDNMKNKVRQSKIGLKASDDTKVKLSLSHMENLSNTGRKFSIEHRAKISKNSKHTLHTKEFKQALKERNILFWKDEDKKKKTMEKIKLALNTEEYKKKVSQRVKAEWSNSISKQKRIKNILRASHLHPNKTEDYVLSMIKELGFIDWKYVGNGDLIIGKKCPDYWNGDRKVIEFFGDY